MEVDNTHLTHHDYDAAVHVFLSEQYSLEKMWVNKHLVYSINYDI